MRRKIGIACCIIAVCLFLFCSPEKLARNQVPGIGHTERIVSTTGGNLYGTVVITSMRDLGDRYEISYCTKISGSTGNVLKPTTGVGSTNARTITVKKQYSGYVFSVVFLVAGLFLINGRGAKVQEVNPSNSQNNTLSSQLATLKARRDAEEITDTEYNELKKHILDNINKT